MRSTIGVLTLALAVVACRDGRGLPTASPETGPEVPPSSPDEPVPTTSLPPTTPTPSATSASSSSSTTMPADDRTAAATAAIEGFMEMQRTCYRDIAACDARAFEAVATGDVLRSTVDQVEDLQRRGAVGVGADTISATVEGAWPSAMDARLVGVQVCVSESFGAAVPPASPQRTPQTNRFVVLVREGDDGVMRMQDDEEVQLMASAGRPVDCAVPVVLVRPVPSEEAGRPTPPPPPDAAPGAAPEEQVRVAFEHARRQLLACVAASPRCRVLTLGEHYTGAALARVQQRAAQRSRNGIAVRRIDRVHHRVIAAAPRPDDPRTVELEVCFDDGAVRVFPVADADVVIDDEWYSWRATVRMQLGDDGPWRVGREDEVSERVLGESQSVCR